MRKTFFSVIAITTLFAIGCKKETIEDLYAEKTGKGTKEVSGVVSASFWRLGTIKLFFANGTTADSVIDNCKVDDLETFNKNGEVTIIHGSVACTINPADGKFAKWELLDNGTRIKETFERDMRGIPAGTVRDYQIEYVAFKKMVINRTVNDPVLGEYEETTMLWR
jgi:hypothetical protein